jgi:serine/threonine-protein kinase HipA
MARKAGFCYVYIQLPGTFDWVPCASLQVNEVGPGAYEGTFTYGRKYLARENVIALDEFHLPLTERPHRITKLKGIPGAVRDASADAWGRRVIEAKLHRPAKDIDEIDYLLNGPDDGAGNLRFGLTIEPPGPKRPYNRTHQLPALIDAAEKLEEDGRLPEEVLEQLEPGTSMGGARPKVTVEDDHKIWLCKLPEKSDRHNIQRIEYATLRLARKAGIRTCTPRLESLAGRDVLMLQRFDREWNVESGRYARWGLVSGLTILDAEDGHSERQRWSYLLLADEIRRWSSKPKEDQKELFRRMVFNAMVTNNDDHPRNHAMVRTPSGWRLSPAYDIVPVALVSQERRDLALDAGRFGRAASIYNILSATDAFGVEAQEAEQEVLRMLGVVSQWRQDFERDGVQKKDMEMLGGAILPPSFHLRHPPDPV